MAEPAGPVVLLGVAGEARRRELAAALRRAGCRVTAPAAGPELLNRARSGGFALLLLEPEKSLPDPEQLMAEARRQGALAVALGDPPGPADLALPPGLPEERVAAMARGLAGLARRLAEREETAGQLRKAFNEARQRLEEAGERGAELEERLARLRERFSRLIDANPDIIYATEAGPAHRNLFVSRRLRELLGHDPQEMIGNAGFWLEHLHPEEREGVLARVRALLAAGGGTLHYRFRHADGGYRRIRDDFTLLRDETGEPKEVIGCWSDVTAEELTGERFRAIFDSVPDGILLVDSGGRIREANPALARMFGHASPEEVTGRSISELLPEERRQAHEAMLSRFFRRPVTRSMGESVDIEGLRADGSRLALQVVLTPFPVLEGEESLVLAVVRDVTRQRADERRIADLIRAYETLSAVNQATVHIRDRGHLLDAVCRVAVEKGGYRLAWIGLLDAEDRWLEPAAAAGATGYLEGLRVSAREEDPEGRGASGRALRSGDAVIVEDLEAAAEYGPWREAARRHGLRASIALPLVVEGRVCGTLNLYAGSAERFSGEELALLSEVAGDLSFGLEFIEREARRRRAEAHIQSLVFHDPHTGLYNREGFLQAAAGLLEEAAPLALAVIDPARLREVNQGLGYETGDRLLQAVARRLREGLAEGEIAGSLGGGHFGLLLPRVGEEEGAVRRLHRLLEELERPLELDGLQVAVQFNAGLALAREEGLEAERLLRRADLAMESVKGWSGIGTFHPGMEPDPGEHALLARLVEGIGTEGYRLHYQPKMVLASGRVDAVEALARWQDPDAGLLPPGRFIPLLERTGLMRRLTPHLLLQAAQARARWLARGVDLQVAVNIAAADAADPRLPEQVDAACAAAGIDATSLVLELTETSVLQETPVVEENLRRLHRMGARIAIDDFGTGHASLSRLVDLPVDQVKIDQHFVGQMRHSPSAMAVARTTIDLGRNLDLEVVAEGMEDIATLAMLREMGCHRAQGYAISRPLPEEDLLEWLSARSGAPR